MQLNMNKKGQRIKLKFIAPFKPYHGYIKEGC